MIISFSLCVENVRHLDLINPTTYQSRVIHTACESHYSVAQPRKRDIMYLNRRLNAITELTKKVIALQKPAHGRVVKLFISIDQTADKCSSWLL